MASESDQNQSAKKPTLASNQEQDFISRLPDAILHIILSRLPMRDAAVTTAVSNRWAPLFPTLPSLKIDADSFNPRDPNSHPKHGEPYVEDVNKWLDVLFSVLESRKTPIKNFQIDVEILDHYDDDFYEVFRVLCVSGVEELVITNNEFDDLYRIPSPVFACNTIVKLEISYCKLVVPSKLTGLRSVKSLKISDVRVADVDLRRMISRCKAMEKLVIRDCHKVKNIVIRAPSLSELVISLCSPVGISLKSVPRLASVKVCFGYYYDLWKNVYASFEERNTGHEESHECFSLSDSDKTFEGTNEVTNLMAFLNGLHVVKDLHLDFSNEYRMVCF